MTGKHPELKPTVRSSDFEECSFVGNRDGRYREKASQLWIEIRGPRPESVREATCRRAFCYLNHPELAWV
jgi:hypothetical protein